MGQNITLEQNTPILKENDRLHIELTHLRRDIHQHPETSYEEVRTAQVIADFLTSIGLEVHTQIGKTGVVAVLNGNKPKSSESISIGLRADMDALDLCELNTFDYKSVHNGKMHGCGHDGHTTMLLGAAKQLSEAPNFAGTVYFIFQPAEEGGHGAKEMIDDGLFDRFPMNEVYGLHNWPGLEANQFAVHPGSVMAATDQLNITIRGKGGHAGIPHNTSDSIVASSQLVNSVQSVISRNLDPNKAGVISITKIHAGEAFNIIPDEVEMAGTIRTFDLETRQLIKSRLSEICKGIGKAYSVDIELNIIDGYPATINHEPQALFAKDSAMKVSDSVLWNQPPSMGAEDFAYMLQEKPGAYVWLGNGGAESSCELHNPTYDFNDRIIPTGVNYWVQLTYDRLASKT